MDARRTLRVNLILASLGAIGGALAAIPITALGKLAAGAPPATGANYLWNMGALALIAAIGSPFLTWSALRRVPLWRAMAEPAAGAVVGGAVALALGTPAAFLLLMPVELARQRGGCNTHIATALHRSHCQARRAHSCPATTPEKRNAGVCYQHAGAQYPTATTS